MNIIKLFSQKIYSSPQQYLLKLQNIQIYYKTDSEEIGKKLEREYLIDITEQKVPKIESQKKWTWKNSSKNRKTKAQKEKIQQFQITQNNILIKNPPKRPPNKYILFQSRMMGFLRNEMGEQNRPIKSAWLFKKVKQYWNGEYDSPEVQEYAEFTKKKCIEEAQVQLLQYQKEKKLYEKENIPVKVPKNAFPLYANEQKSLFKDKFDILYQEVVDKGFYEKKWELCKDKSQYNDSFVKFKKDIYNQLQNGRQTMQFNVLLGYKWKFLLSEEEKKPYLLKLNKMQQEKERDIIDNNKQYKIPFKKKISPYTAFIKIQFKTYEEDQESLIQELKDNNQEPTKRAIWNLKVSKVSKKWKECSEQDKKYYQNLAQTMNQFQDQEYSIFQKKFGINKDLYKVIKEKSQEQQEIKDQTKLKKQLRMYQQLSDNDSEEEEESDDEVILYRH